jgi:hypothetical protein
MLSPSESVLQMESVGAGALLPGQRLGVVRGARSHHDVVSHGNQF